MANKNLGFFGTYFYFWMSLLIAAIVVYGFSNTIDHNLIHPTLARPSILYIHAAIFSSWVVFYIIQSGLVRNRNVRLHMKLGWLGAALGVAIVLLGVSTAITMARFRVTYLHATHTESDLIVQFFDMIAFSIPFALAIYFRKKIEMHRRLILVASCCLTSAAFGRFPMIPTTLFYAGVDALICIGILRDLVVLRRVHPVYCYGLFPLIFGQSTAMFISLHGSSSWSWLARLIVGLIFTS